MKPTLRGVAFGPQGTPGTPAPPVAPWIRIRWDAGVVETQIQQMHYNYDFSTRQHIYTFHAPISYINPILLAECRPGGGPHPILHRAAFQRIVRRTVRRHQRGHR